MNIKKIWSGIREIVNLRNSKPHNIAQLKVGGKIIHTSRDISNKLNEFFVNVGPNTESSIPISHNVTIKIYETKISI